MKVIYVEKNRGIIDVYVYRLNKSKRFLHCDKYSSDNPLFYCSFSCYLETSFDLLFLCHYSMICDNFSFHRDACFALRNSIPLSFSLTRNPFFTKSGKPRLSL